RIGDPMSGRFIRFCVAFKHSICNFGMVQIAVATFLPASAMAQFEKGLEEYKPFTDTIACQIGSTISKDSLSEWRRQIDLKAPIYRSRCEIAFGKLMGGKEGELKK